MGDAARKLSKTKELLQAHPWCIYCGAPATTTDHCPPRSFFKSRQWPDTYEYPACEPCNRSARLDEQALATLIRADTLEGATDTERLEWERLATGVKNNQPHLVAEWESISRNQIKHSLRLAYGREGDLRRQRGWGALHIGPLTHAVIERFMIKLSKALYYRHNEKIFDGVLYIHHINRLSMDTTPEYLKSIYHMAPALPEIKRNGKSLFEVDPVWWSPSSFRRRLVRCPKPVRPIRLSFADRWSIWCALVATPRTWPVSLNRRHNQSATG
jgi:hypothetical protein